MKDRRGFTLIELLAVLVILVAISLTAVMGISASLERNDQKEVEEQEKLAFNAAKIYFTLNDVDRVTIDELILGEYLDDKKVNKLDGNKCIVMEDNTYKYGNC